MDQIQVKHHAEEWGRGFLSVMDECSPSDFDIEGGGDNILFPLIDDIGSRRVDTIYARVILSAN